MAELTASKRHPPGFLKACLNCVKATTRFAGSRSRRSPTPEASGGLGLRGRDGSNASSMLLDGLIKPKPRRNTPVSVPPPSSPPRGWHDSNSRLFGDYEDPNHKYLHSPPSAGCRTPEELNLRPEGFSDLTNEPTDEGLLPLRRSSRKQRHVNRAPMSSSPTRSSPVLPVPARGPWGSARGTPGKSARKTKAPDGLSFSGLNYGYVGGLPVLPHAVAVDGNVNITLGGGQLGGLCGADFDCSGDGRRLSGDMGAFGGAFNTPMKDGDYDDVKR
jgi:hypothetical protein